MRIVGNQSGHAAFYILLIFPILITLSIIIFDISQWQSTKNTLQNNTDQIALLASRSLPNTELAKVQIEEFVASLPGISLSSENPMLISSNEIRFTLEAKSGSIFDFLLQAAGFPHVVFDSKQEVRAQIIPGDYIIILSDSASLRPKPYSSWGDVALWPASQYFNLSLAPLSSNDSDSPNYSQALWQQLDFRRWATEQCFNPIFSSFKIGAALIADSLQRQLNNRVTALFTPGSVNGVGFEQTFPLDFYDQQHRTSTPLWFANKPSSWFGDESCIYLADPQQDFSGAYILPENLLSFRDIDPNCTSAVLPLYLSYHYPTGRVTDCFRNNVSLAERIYYRSAQDVEHDLSGEMLFQTISQALAVFTQTTVDDLERIELRRGNLRAVSKRTIIAIVDTIPQLSSEFISLIKAIKNANVQLILLFISHDNLATNSRFLSSSPLDLPNSTTLKEELDLRFTELESSALTGNAFQLYRIEDPEKIVETALPKIVESLREVSISK